MVARLSKALKIEEKESINTETQYESNAEATGNPVVVNEIIECPSNDNSMDIDMADIVIIDEYDSTKNDSKNESSSKRVNNNEMIKTLE